MAPYRPYLTLLDFWFWGAAKDSVYKFRPANLDLLKTRINEYITQVTPATWKKVGDNFKIRITACQARRGAHIEIVIFHKFV